MQRQRHWAFSFLCRQDPQQNGRRWDSPLRFWWSCDHGLDLDCCTLPVILSLFMKIEAEGNSAGTFGRVLECWDRKNKSYVAIKIVRNVEKYRDAAIIEVQIFDNWICGNWQLNFNPFCYQPLQSQCRAWHWSYTSWKYHTLNSIKSLPSQTFISASYTKCVSQQYLSTFYDCSWRCWTPWT